MLMRFVKEIVMRMLSEGLVFAVSGSATNLHRPFCCYGVTNWPSQTIQLLPGHELAFTDHSAILRGHELAFTYHLAVRGHELAFTDHSATTGSRTGLHIPFSC
jgi:hypothetical protein